MTNPFPDVSTLGRLGTSATIVNLFNDQFDEVMVKIGENPEVSVL
jgi:hypothetical protein